MEYNVTFIGSHTVVCTSVDKTYDLLKEKGFIPDSMSKTVAVKHIVHGMVRVGHVCFKKENGEQAAVW